jgi:hypothetical protein
MVSRQFHYFRTIPTIPYAAHDLARKQVAKGDCFILLCPTKSLWERTVAFKLGKTQLHWKNGG